MSKVTVKLVAGGEMVVFGKMMYEGETRELDHRQAAQLAAMAPGRVVVLGGGQGREEALAEVEKVSDEHEQKSVDKPAGRGRTSSKRRSDR